MREETCRIKITLESEVKYESKLQNVKIGYDYFMKYRR